MLDTIFKPVFFCAVVSYQLTHITTQMSLQFLQYAIIATPHLATSPIYLLDLDIFTCRTSF